MFDCFSVCAFCAQKCTFSVLSAQLHSTMMAVGVLDIVICSSIQAWSVLISPVYIVFAYIFYISRWFVYVTYACVCIEASVIRLLIDRYWKRAPPISDEYFAFFLVAFNSFVGLMVPILNIIARDNIAYLHRISGL